MLLSYFLMILLYSVNYVFLINYNVHNKYSSYQDLLFEKDNKNTKATPILIYLIL